jgi:uncharacterized membrane protein
MDVHQCLLLTQSGHLQFVWRIKTNLRPKIARGHCVSPVSVGHVLDGLIVGALLGSMLGVFITALFQTSSSAHKS